VICPALLEQVADTVGATRGLFLLSSQGQIYIPILCYNPLFAQMNLVLLEMLKRLLLFKIHPAKAVGHYGNYRCKLRGIETLARENGNNQNIDATISYNVSVFMKIFIEVT
jgi:hypothetical protein